VKGDVRKDETALEGRRSRQEKGLPTVKVVVRGKCYLEILHGDVRQTLKPLCGVEAFGANKFKKCFAAGGSVEQDEKLKQHERRGRARRKGHPRKKKGKESLTG